MCRCDKKLELMQRFLKESGLQHSFDAFCAQENRLASKKQSGPRLKEPKKLSDMNDEPEEVIIEMTEEELQEIKDHFEEDEQEEFIVEESEQGE